MTERLYYDNAKLLTFDAHIVEIRPTERGPIVRLDRTAFYPTSGGQPHDIGTLNDIPVVDVWEDEAHEVWHLLARPLSPAVTLPHPVHGVVDEARRFDHMQQHSGQHLLSATFDHLYKAKTLSFHLGSESSTIDVDMPHLPAEKIRTVEEEVNHLIWQDLPVRARFVTQEELAAIPLRKPPKVKEHIRIVSMGDYEHIACGGTHVSRTGEIGLIKITKAEHYKGHVRVHFLCGGRALRHYRQTLTILQETSGILSVGHEETPQAVRRLQEELKETRAALNKAKATLLQAEAEELWHTTPETGGVRCILRHWERPFAEVRNLARTLREKPRTLTCLAATEARGLRLVCARSDDLPDIHAGKLLRTLVQSLGGRGGGSPALAQGGAPPTSAETVLRAMEEAVRGL